MAITITVGTNSYVTETETNVYFRDRPYGKDWLDFDAEQNKPAALCLAARIIDQQSFVGSITAEAQAMAWPRIGASDREGRLIADTEVPQAVKNAQMEMAIQIMREDPTVDDADASIKRVKAGNFEVEFAGRNPSRDLPDFVRSLLEPFLSTSDNSIRLAP